MDALNYEFMARQRALDWIEHAGVAVRVSSYDQDLIDEAAETKGRVGPEVRCCGQLSASEEATLVALRTGEGALVGFCAVKLCDMAGRSLDRYLWDTYRHQYAYGNDPFDLHDLPEVVRSVAGRVAYVGDFWLSSEKRIDITAFAILIMSIAHRDLDADWHYFFTRHRNYWRGLGARYLATTNVSFAIQWNVPVDHRRDDDCLYLSRRDEAHRAERKYVQHFPPPSKAQ